MLSIVPTPVGNLSDMTPRALQVLKDARAVYCEDTRRTRNLMSHFGLSTPLLRYQEHDSRDAERMVERLKAGEDLALVSDGGMPGLSDPGRRVVALARKNGLPVTALPGPSAAVAALAGSGLPGDSFIFLGFLPRSSGKQRRALQEAAALDKTIIVYESPFRVVGLLGEAQTVLGPKAQCRVVRELSKMHEEWACGTVEEVRRALAARKEHLGEHIVLLHPKEDPENG